MSEVILTKDELYVSLIVGGRRRIESMCAKRIDSKSFYSENQLECDVQAAAAELAYSKFRNVHWCAGVDTFKGADVGKNVQIRHSKLEDACLILREADSDDEYYVLVTGELPRFQIAGWILGRDARKPSYIKSPNGKPPAWFVPQSALAQFKIRTL